MPAPLCPRPAASHAGEPPRRLQKPKSKVWLIIFFPLPAISPSLNDPLSCRCAYYVLIFWSCATKARQRGQAKSPLRWGHHRCHHWGIKPHHQLLQRNRRRCSITWFLEEGLPRSPFCPGFYSPSLLALFLLTRRPLPTAWAPLDHGIVAMGTGRKLIQFAQGEDRAHQNKSIGD